MSSTQPTQLHGHRAAPRTEDIARDILVESAPRALDQRAFQRALAVFGDTYLRTYQPGGDPDDREEAHEDATAEALWSAIGAYGSGERSVAA